jgi:hypothetical protein
VILRCGQIRGKYLQLASIKNSAANNHTERRPWP